MKQQPPRQKTGTHPKPERLPYPPSWVDRMQVWVEHLPIPAWLFYLLAWVVFYLGLTVIQWGAGQYPAGTFFPFHAFVTGSPWYVLALTHYLDRHAAGAFQRFLPAIDATPEEQTELRYRLTTLPARPTLYATLAGVVLAFSSSVIVPPGIQTLLFNFSLLPYSSIPYYLLFAMGWMAFGMALYHTYHQLRQIDIIYTRYTTVNLFQLRPLYAFAALSARTAIGFGIALCLGLLLTPSNDETIVMITNGFIFLPQFILIPVAFLLPLMGIHRLLVEEKGRYLDENQQAVERTMRTVHERIGEGKLDDIDQLHKLTETIETQTRMLRQIPTWPWQAGTPRTVAATMFLPIVLWLIQQLLLRVLP